MRRGMGKAMRYVWRSHVAWVVLTAVVIGDTWWWARDSLPVGIIPQSVKLVLLTGHGTSPSPLNVEILATPSLGDTPRRFFRPTLSMDWSTWDTAQYWILLTLQARTKGLWAPCVQREWAVVRVVDVSTGNALSTGGPTTLFSQALSWYETEPMGPTEEGDAARSRLVERARAGNVERTILWGGVLHDGLMSLLTLLWLVLTFAHGRRLVLGATVERRRRRRREAGLCERCGYPLTGQHFSRCPECGAELESR